MSLMIPDDLPARQVLEQEGLVIIPKKQQKSLCGHSLRILLLNLMPEKIKTETQILRMLGTTSLLVELILLTTASYQSKNTPASHIDAFYTTWDKIAHHRFDGLIVTGAPIETIAFQEVHYWTELTQIFDWARDYVTSIFTLCWGAQAALYHWYDIPKHILPQKQFGLYQHSITKYTSLLVKGMKSPFIVPVSRHSETRQEDLQNHPTLSTVLESKEVGLCLVEDAERLCFFMFNHLEYDTDTLGEEYQRDRTVGKPTPLPYQYFPQDDPNHKPINLWHHSGYHLFGNWLSILLPEQYP